MNKMTFNKLVLRIWIYSFVVMTGLFLMFFSNPNRLAHDQIDHKIYTQKYDDAQIFQNDYLFGSPKIVLMDNRFSFKILALIAKITNNSDEIARWVLLPVIFIVFTIGFFELIYFLTKNIAISLIVSLLANFHVPHIFTAEWGLPGPSELDPWTFYQMFLPLLFLFLYVAIRDKNKIKFLTVIIAAGLLGNLHIITAFNFIGASLVAFVLANKKTFKIAVFTAISGILAVITSIPYLLTHYVPGVSHTTNFDPANPSAWAALKIIANHTTIEGKMLNIKVWFVDYWYTIIPLLIIWLVYILNKRRKKVKLSTFDIYSFYFLLGIVIFNFSFSLAQLFRLYVLHQLPFWNEPRGMQFVYLILFSYLGLFLLDLWNKIKPWFTFPKILQIILASIFLTSAIFWRSHPYLAARYLKHIRPRSSYSTCDNQMYRTITALKLQPDIIIMQEPDYWSGFRICTRRASVVQNRDKALAYSFGSDMMLAWYQRYQDVTHAFSIGGIKLVETAQKYNARVIVSRYCTSLPSEEILRHETVPGEGCIDILKPPTDSATL